MRILYIDIDSLRADHLGCYGYHRNTSPHIDALAKEGLRFEHYYTSDAPCLPSRTALYSGRFGIQTGVVGHNGTAADPKLQGKFRGFRDWFGLNGLAKQLQLKGLHTAMISPFGQRHSAHWFYAGFNEIHNTGKNGWESAEEVQPVIDKWLADNAGGDNWYLHVNVWDPHTPFRVPMSFGEPFADAPIPAWMEDEAMMARHAKIPGPHTALDLMMYTDVENPKYPRQPGKVTDKKSMKRMVDGYDTAVLYADAVVGKIVAQLKAAGVYDQTVIVVSADHGENLAELGIYQEHATADVGTCRIPMIVKWPGGAKGKVDGALHYNIDWAPTLMDLLGGAKQELWDGTSFAGAVLAGKGPAGGREELIISQCCHVCQRSVRWGDWLYIRTYHDGFHLFPPEMLFDLGSDPYEQHDVAESRPEICREAAWRLSRWHDAQMQKMAVNCSDVTDPLWTVIFEGGPCHAMHDPGRSELPEYLPRLEKTGRGAAAKALREKYKRFLEQEKPGIR